MYQYPLTDRLSLIGAHANGGKSKPVHWTVLREASMGRNRLVNDGLMRVEGNVLVVTDKGREALAQAANDDLF